MAICLQGLSNLKALDLYDTNITDAGLESLEELTDLQELDLRGTRISGAGLVHLEKLKNLPTLELLPRSAERTGFGVGCSTSLD